MAFRNFPDAPQDPQISNYMKILRLGPSYCTRTGGKKEGRTDRQTNLTKLIVLFLKSANEANK